MNIIIPIGGSGKRFIDEGYRKPKPLINALGKPILFYNLEHLRLDEQDTIYIIYRQEFSRYNFEDLIVHQFGSHNFKFIPLINDTRGASETVLYALNEMTETELKKLIIVIDADNFYPEDIIGMAKSANQNLIFYKKDYGKNPIYSYITTAGDKVLDIKEKVKISDNACVGAYCFENGQILGEVIKSVIASGEKQLNEYYISSLYSYMLQNDIGVYSKEINDFVCLGTPHQVKSFSSSFSTSGSKYRFCFELFNTLVTLPVASGRIDAIKPIENTIHYLNFLHSQGHTIIINTTRDLIGSKGEPIIANTEMVKIIPKILKRFDIQYDEILYRKPFAHFYIDAQSVIPSDDLEKETGFYNAHPSTRSSNKIEIYDKYINKYSSSIEGEKYYYKHIPEKFKVLFPDLLDSNENSIKLSKVIGIPLSFLNVNKTLTETILVRLLDTLGMLHAFPMNDNVNIYLNYYKKVKDRLNAYDFNVFQGFRETSEEILDYLQAYEKNDKGTHGMIHGDPVLTNILIDSSDNIKMIDMRGKLGENFSIFGDILYDYSKVYQSLVGYDFILLDKPLDKGYINKNKRVFEDYILSKFGNERLSDIKFITKSLLLSLIPIHNNDKCKAYYNLIFEF